MIEVKRLLTPSTASPRKRKKRQDLIPGQSKILKYLKVKEKSAECQKEPTGSEGGNSNKGVIRDPLLGDSSQGASRLPSKGDSHPATEERGGEGR